MLQTIHASAPGKLFLIGEYAVLDGAPAVLTAIDRRVLVTITEAKSESKTGSEPQRWRVRTPGLGEAQHSSNPIELGVAGELPDGLGDPERSNLRVFDAVRSTVLARTGQLPPALDIAIDSTAFFDGAHKLGLGSSAAVAVALTAALAEAAGLPADRHTVFELALSAHRLAQGGTGSGGDVAASVFGGLIEYSRDEEPLQLIWPHQLKVMAVVTGTGSSTTGLVAKVSEYARRDERQYAADIDRLAVLARQAKDTLSVPQGFLRLLSDYFAALIELDEDAHAGIVSDHHLRLHALAAGLGAVFKTSGAGGGDVGLVFSVDNESTDALTAAFAGAGARVVPLGFCATGLQTDGTVQTGETVQTGTKDGPAS